MSIGESIILFLGSILISILLLPIVVYVLYCKRLRIKEIRTIYKTWMEHTNDEYKEDMGHKTKSVIVRKGGGRFTTLRKK